MAKKKQEEVEETQTEATSATTEASEEVSTPETTEEQPKKAAEAKSEEAPSIFDSVVDTLSSAVSSVANTIAGVVGGNSTETATEAKAGSGGRAQRVGVVTSDKMTKTVTVRVDRLIKHPKYRRYVRRKKQFMAHDEMGAAIGDKVRIVETRPLSARKRWRVVEIIQKAAK